MKLSEYLESNQISFSDFAKQIGAKSRATVYRYVNGDRKMPSPAMLDRIYNITNGAVCANDFYVPIKKSKKTRTN